MFSIRRGLPVVLAAAVFTPAAAAQLPMESMPPPGPPPLSAPAHDERRELPVDLRRLAQAQPRPGDDGFEPISELPPDERLPAAPMLVAAYVFVILALFLYLFSLSRRLGAVKQEIARLESDVKRGGRP